jgi:CRP-like cAMP-binding protein
LRSDNSKIKDIFKDLVFDEYEIEIITSVFHKVEAEKGTILLHPGDYVNEHYYILDGCLRAFHIDEHGKEHTVQFGIKD